MYKNILVPTDGSAGSHKAAAHAVALAQAIGAKVTGFFAAPPATPIVYRDNLPVGFAQPQEHAQMIERTARKYLDHIARVADKEGVPFEGVHVTNDYPADAIVAAAGEHKCDLIVMATHGSGGLRDLFIGSVAQKVLQQSKVPVLVLR